LLRYSDPQWLKTLRRGVNVILVGIVLMIFTMAAAFGLAFAKPAHMTLIMGLISMGNGLVFLAGAWLLTAPDPSGLGEDQYGKARKLIRVTLLIGLVNNAVSFAASMQGFYKEVTIVIQVIGLMAALVGLVGQFAQLYYLKHLALRVPDLKLSARANFLMYAIGITNGVMIVFGAVGAIGLAMGSTVAGVGGGCIAGLAALPLLVFWIMYIVMLERFGRSFKEQAELARQVWAEAA
jgi:hypothetical protein